MTLNAPLLPPLNSLKAFDAVARNGSMAKAASELGVSASSVTHHLHSLEEFVGLKLLKRTPNSVTLTAEGSRYFEAIRPAFDILSVATDSLVSLETDEPLRISCVPTLGNSWFATQLATLEQRLSGLSIHCDFSPTPVNFDQGPVDLAIRYGAGDYPDADTELLFIDKIAPVCTPETASMINSPEDLLEVSRLSNPDTTPSGQSMWSYWGSSCFGQEFGRQVDVSSGSALKSARFTIEALKVNNYVTIIDYVTAKEDLGRGRLVSPVGKWIDAPYGYYMLTPKRRTQREATKILKTLLKRTVKTLRPPEEI